MEILGEIFTRWRDHNEALGLASDYDRFLGQLPEDVVNVIAVECLFGEMLNGGFDVYFSNSGGHTIGDAIRGMIAMGLAEYAEIAREALAVMGDKFVMDRAERCDRMYADTPGYGSTDIFDHLDDRFYDLEAADSKYSATIEEYAVNALRRYQN
ncbi:DUF4375 domain-containing protein [Mesorhizobium sp. VNQ89]|uniref:DMP19 family protein n=1 Tax=Mesorhizobium quangtriensis TaxID=3157709 RepID=UPI0032B7A531